jgi:subtilisin family serine protease
MKTRKSFRWVAFLATTLLLLNDVQAQLIPPDSTTYYGTGQSGNIIRFHRPPDSLMIPGKVIIHFRQGTLDSTGRSALFDGYYHPPITKKKGQEQVLWGPYGLPMDQRGFPDNLRARLFAEKFRFNDATNIVRDSSLKHTLISYGGHWLRRLTTASPIDTLSVTRTGDTTGCDHANWMILTLDSTQNPLVVSYLLTLLFQHDIILATPDYRGGIRCSHPGDTAADTKYRTCQLNTHMINAEAAWWYEVGDPSIIIGVTDQGVDYRHPDFGDTVLGVGHKFQVAWNFDADSGGRWIYKDGSHGTQMAGIAGALTNNNCVTFLDQSVAGIAGGWGTLVTHPSYPARGRGVTIDIAASDIGNNLTGFISSLFEESARSPFSPYGWGAHALNISEGSKPLPYDFFFPPTHCAINYAFENGVVICAAMHEAEGTTYYGDSTTSFFPADYEEPWVIAVGGSIPNKSKVPQSDYGQTMDLLAPAGSSTDACGTGWLANYTTHADVPGAFTFNGSGGTSAACANVTGSVGLLLSHFHRLDTTTFQHTTPEDYQGILKASAWRGDAYRLSDTSKQNAWTDSTGWGHLDVGKAFEMLDSDRTAYPHSGYRLFHYSNSDTTLMTFGAWTATPDPHDYPSTTFAPSYDPNMNQFPDTIHTYGHRNYQIGYVAAKAQYRIVKLSVTLPDVWERDSIPLFAWGTSGGATSKTGWNVSAPYNFETGWTQVLNGTGWDRDSLNEGIFHNQGTTFVLRTGQWKLTVGSTTMIVPPDSELGVNFTVFGRLSGTSGVDIKQPLSSDESLTIFQNLITRMVTAKFYTDQPHEGLTLELYDVLGRQVASMPVGHINAGWSKLSYSSANLVSGMYVCRIAGSGYVLSKNFVIVR